ncbi:hypothetical protein K8090_13205 [Halomonas meridiana]|jgi:hypothetical protein|uniref:hypothetical protein n=1 Tax=Vreelandella aquamarina TaxID=77097 RepID=UPI001E65D13D|nr:MULTISPECIES: hypothetical protein [Halomonas]MCD1652153.1 hypothetical protein [Halomonas axialensis]MCD2088691.1 hypothetical protein [Halomonas meridiana]|tara:strand:- start:2024 stop:2491 length:468 start_codon:yes stop_codon:yes gene_type:complete
MELIIKLLLGTAGFGALSWASWGFASSHDTGLMLTAMALGFVAFICGFLAIAKIIHYSKWAATLFWTVMLGTLTYTFPPLGLTQLGWLGWGIITFLAVWSLIVVAYKPAAGASKKSYLANYDVYSGDGSPTGIDYSGYPSARAIRHGTYRSTNDL